MARSGPGVMFGGTIVVLTLVVIGGIWWMAHQPGAPGSPNEVVIPEATISHQHIGSILQSAQQYLANGENKQAEAILVEATRQYAGDQDLRVAYTQALVALSKYDQAYEQIVAALSIGPRTPELEFLAGTIASTTKRYDRAVEHFSAAQTANPLSSQYPVYLAQAQRELGELDAAKISLLRVVKLDPQNDMALGTLADIAFQENKMTLAKNYIEQARRINPDEPTWRIVEARILNRNGQADKAIMVLQGLSEEERLTMPVLRLNAEAYGLLKKPGSAAEMYAKAVELRPRHPEMALEAALWFERAGDPDAAKMFADRAAMLGSEQGRQLSERLSEAGGG
jgi:predicted Zn-dependent protease